VEELKKKDSDAVSMVEALKKDIAKKDFLIETPTAKNYIDILEAYAEKNSISIDEAWKSDKFRPIAETAQRVEKTLITNNRITPIQSQKLDKIADQVRTTGNDSAKIDLVKEYFRK
jgi:glycine cleavage system pyridoxal-binding protein P